jgi:hypothetical protein
VELLALILMAPAQVLKAELDQLVELLLGREPLEVQA